MGNLIDQIIELIQQEAERKVQDGTAHPDPIANLYAVDMEVSKRVSEIMERMVSGWNKKYGAKNEYIHK